MEPLVRDITANIANDFVTMLDDLNRFFIALFLGAPAIASMFQIPLERRLPVVARSYATSVTGGVTLTILAAVAIALANNGVHALVPPNFKFAIYFEFAAIALTAIAIGVQLGAWRTFSWRRAAALLSAFLMFPALVAIADLHDSLAK